MAASGHVTLACFALLDIDDGIEKVGFAMLATKVATDDLIMISKMCLAVFTAINALSIEIDVVGQAHLGCGWDGCSAYGCCEISKQLFLVTCLVAALECGPIRILTEMRVLLELSRSSEANETCCTLGLLRC